MSQRTPDTRNGVTGSRYSSSIQNVIASPIAWLFVTRTASALAVLALGAESPLERTPSSSRHWDRTSLKHTASSSAAFSAPWHWPRYPAGQGAVPEAEERRYVYKRDMAGSRPQCPLQHTKALPHVAFRARLCEDSRQRGTGHALDWPLVGHAVEILGRRGVAAQHQNFHETFQPIITTFESTPGGLSRRHDRSNGAPPFRLSRGC